MDLKDYINDGNENKGLCIGDKIKTSKGTLSVLGDGWGNLYFKDSEELLMTDSFGKLSKLPAFTVLVEGSTLIISDGMEPCIVYRVIHKRDNIGSKLDITKDKIISSVSDGKQTSKIIMEEDCVTRLEVSEGDLNEEE